MRRVLVRYKVKPERVAEHEALVRAVFEELTAMTPAQIRYGAFKQPDGVSFVHIAFVKGDTNPLPALASFRAFTANIAERCDEPPVTAELAGIGVYGFDS